MDEAAVTQAATGGTTLREVARHWGGAYEVRAGVNGPGCPAVPRDGGEPVSAATPGELWDLLAMRARG